MKFALKCGLAAAALFALSTPSLALNPQPEPPGVTHNPDMSVQNSNPTLTTPVSKSCGAASGRPDVVAGGPQAAGDMSARASGGTAGNAGSANGDKCAKGASTMGAASPAAH